MENLTTELNWHFKQRGPYYLVNLTFHLGNVIDGTLVELRRETAQKSGKTRVAYQYTEKVLKNIQNFVSDQNQSVYEVYTTLLDFLSEELKRKTGLISGGERSQRADGGENYTWQFDVADDQSHGLEEYLAECCPKKTIESLRDKFIRDLIDNRKEWTDLDSSGAVTRMRSFIQNEIAGLFQAGPQDLFVKAFCGKDATATKPGPNGTTMPTEELTTAVTSFFEVLKNHLRPMIQFDPAGGDVDSYPNWKVLMVPENCRELADELETQAAFLGYEVERSNMEDKIIAYRAVLGIPPYALRVVYSSEEVYEATDRLGLHISEGKENHYRNLPNPLPVSAYCLGGHHVSNRREEALAQECKDMVLRAIELGLATKEMDDQHEIYFVSIIKAPDKAQDLIDAYLKSKLGSKKNLKEIVEDAGVEMEPHKLMISRVRSILSSTELREGNNDGYYKEMAGRVLRLLPELHQPLRKTLQICEKLQADLQKAEVLSRKRQLFIDCLASELVRWETDDRWMYVDQRGDERCFFSPNPTSQVQRSAPAFFAFDAFERLLDEDIDHLQQEVESLDKTDSSVASDMKVQLKEFHQRLETERHCTQKSDERPYPIGSRTFEEDVSKAQQDEALGGKIRDFYDILICMTE